MQYRCGTARAHMPRQIGSEGSFCCAPTPLCVCCLLPGPSAAVSINKGRMACRTGTTSSVLLLLLLLQRFAESLLEVADNLESAARAVPRDVLQPGAQVSTDVVTGYLRALLEGVTATERVLLKARHCLGAAMSVCVATVSGQRKRLMHRVIERIFLLIAHSSRSACNAAQQTMADKGVQRIETAEGDAFDPNTQEAMSMLPVVDADKAPGTVANVWQSGYRIHDRILRAAKVIVWAEAQ